MATVLDSFWLVPFVLVIRYSVFTHEPEPPTRRSSSEPNLLLRLLNVTQEIKNGGVEALRLLNLRKMTTIVEQDCRGSLQFSFENPGVIRRHEPVLSSPDNQSWLPHCGHCGLQRRNLPTPKSAMVSS